MRLFLKIIKWVVVTIAGALMLIAILSIFAPRFGWEVNTVLSGSMEPALKVAGVVVVAPVLPVNVKEGDILCFKSPVNNQKTTHRVISIIVTGDIREFKTQGDANDSPDPYIVRSRDIFGVVKFHIPYLGYLITFIQTPLGFLITVGIPGLLIIGLEMKNIWSVLGEEEKKKKAKQASVKEKSADGPDDTYSSGPSP